MDEQKMAQDNLILKVLVGAHLYGTNTALSDKDYMGIFIPDKDYVMGTRRCEQVEIRTNPSSSGIRNKSTDTDTVLYSLPKFIHLAANNNPNIVELFFIPTNSITYINQWGELLGMSAPAFISKKVKHTFLGYAYSQKQKVLTKKPIGNRTEYIEKYGFDVKFASHIIRLLSEGIQLLVEGKITFPLSNNNYIRDIKEGKVPLEKILADSERIEALVEQAYVNSTVRNTPDLEKINRLQVHMLESFWRR